MTSANWRAVFAHEASLIRAKATVKRLVALGFKTAKVENRGCNDFAAVLESPEFSKYQVRSAFAREAARANLGVTYAAAATVRAKPGEVNVVFGHSGSLAGADALRRNVGAVGWRDTDVAYGGPRDWRVVWPNVPGSASEATVLAAVKAGFAVELELAGQ